jgi:hypothetical protein
MESPQAQGREVASDADAIVRITRSSSYADRLRSYQILIDGREAARVKAGQSLEISVSPGSHSVVAKVDWCGSNTINFDVGAGHTACFECASKLPGPRLLLALVYVVFMKNQYLTLAQIE